MGSIQPSGTLPGMARFRVTLEFDLEVLDEEAAKAAATAAMRHIIDTELSQGAAFEAAAGQSPEVITHGLAQDSPRAVATTVAVLALAKGMEQFPWLRFSNYKGSNEQIAP